MTFLTSFFSKHVIPFALAALTIIILGNLLVPGYVLTLDMVWVDTLSLSWSADGFNNLAPLYLLLYILGFILPASVVQKLMLFGLFFSLLYLPYRFLPFLNSNASRLFAGLLYTLNPFVYARLLAGQWGVLLGYACLPLVLYTLTRLLEKRDIKSGLLFGATLSLMGAFSIHFLYLSLVLSVFWLGAHFAKFLFTDRKALNRSFVTACLSGALLFVTISTYWLVPAFTRETPLETRFDTAHFEGFSASENHLISTPLNLAVLGGFWGEGEEWRYYFFWPQDQPLFWLAAFFILTLVAFGFVTLVRARDKRFAAILLLLLGIFSYILALGAWGGTFHAFNLWVYENIPGWSGLRDSHKIAGVLALVYVLFASIGVDKLVSLSKANFPFARTAIPLLFILPLLFGMYELFGFRGQLTPVEYPASWYEARTILHSSVPPTEKMLILPWQGYFSLPFNNQLIVANPTSVFFGEDQTVAGRSVGMENIYDQEVDTEYKSIDDFLHTVPENSPAVVVDFLRSHHIRYLFIIVNQNVVNQNHWLMPTKIVSDPNDTSVLLDPKESMVVKGLLQAPHEKLIDSDIIFYRFDY